MTEYSPVTVTGAAPDSESSPPLKEKAADTAQAAKEGGAQVAGTAADKAKDVAAETKRQARDLLGEARGQMHQQATEQHRNLVSNLRSVGEELRSMTERSERNGIASALASQAGDRVRGAADWLDKRQPGDLLEEIRSFARRRPGVFLLGTALAGVAAGRLTRGAAAAQSEQSGGSTDAATDAAPVSAGDGAR